MPTAFDRDLSDRRRSRHEADSYIERGWVRGDGRIAKQLIGEDSPIKKEYLVRVQGKIAGNGLRMLNHGLKLDGEALSQ